MSNVNWPVPLIRLNPWYPGQFGVPGTDNETGLRTDSHGAIFYVDPNAVGVSDGRDGTNPNDPLETVGAALTKCQPYRGDVIAVMANNSWQYGDPSDLRATAIAESVTVTVPGVRIVGVASGGQGVYWSPAAALGTCITVHAIDVTIEGFFFTGGAFGGTAISSVWDGITTFGENLTVRHCVFDDTIDTGVQLEYSWYCDIHDCLFQGCDAYGVYTAAAGSGTAYTRIHNNSFIDCATAAIALLGGADDNFIYGNRIYNGNAQAAGVATNEGINTTGGARNMVTGNWFSCLLTVPAAGDIDDLCTGSATDAWTGNYCTNGLLVTTPT